MKKEGAFLIRKRRDGYTQSQPYALSKFHDGIIHHSKINFDGQFFVETRDTNPVVN